MIHTKVRNYIADETFDSGELPAFCGRESKFEFRDYDLAGGGTDNLTVKVGSNKNFGGVYRSLGCAFIKRLF